MVETGDPRTSYMSACCKMIASDTAMSVTTDALQIAAGYGYMTEYEVERFYRDAKIMELYEGSRKTQKNTIARAILGNLR